MKRYVLLPAPAAVLTALLALSALPPVAATTDPPRSVTGPGLYGSRWNPCEAITYRVNPRGGYAGATDEIARAFRRIATESGLRFRASNDPGADITLQWVTPRQNPVLRGGIAAAMATTSIEHDGVHETVQGAIDLDRTAGLRRGFPSSGTPGWGQVYLHEIAHVVGLRHVRDRTQVMHPTLGQENLRLGHADRRRLHRVGSAAGCIPSSMR